MFNHSLRSLLGDTLSSDETKLKHGLTLFGILMSRSANLITPIAFAVPSTTIVANICKKIQCDKHLKQLLKYISKSLIKMNTAKSIPDQSPHMLKREICKYKWFNNSLLMSNLHEVQTTMCTYIVQHKLWLAYRGYQYIWIISSTSLISSLIVSKLLVRFIHKCSRQILQTS